MRELSARESVEKRVAELLAQSEKRGRPMYTAFLNEQERFFAERLLRGKNAAYRFWGGDERCIRTMLCLSPENEGGEDFPIFPITVTFRPADSLTHRDFLGAFLSLGIERGQIGDIFVCEGYAVAFCTKIARTLITDSVVKIGRAGVTVRDGILGELPEARFEEITAVVASLRADCLVGALTGLSREKSADFIRSGRFMLNCEECAAVSRTVGEGDILTLRGYGKFTVLDEGTETKKGKIRVRLNRYG